ncbi:helix-turn-helix domain-containing protein [Providencia alcalifaciens]|uniref:helix-turn-helix domain-containing protein n=1 Tax=Providencia alcalifaciens TaxID=126385 RepID=UPI0006854103|nr:helix-turn-helix transcriptional regulator [Providencia alcalifaciens]
MLSPKEIVGKNIRKNRLKQGLRESELARKLFCSQQHISRIELGMVRLNINQIEAISTALSVELDDLLDGVGYQENECANTMSYIKYYQSILF